MELKSLHLPLQSPSARFSVRLDSEFSINLRLLTSHILHTTVLVFSLSFCTGTKNVLYFSIIPPEHSITLQVLPEAHLLRNSNYNLICYVILQGFLFKIFKVISIKSIITCIMTVISNALVTFIIMIIILKFSNLSSDSRQNFCLQYHFFLLLS